MHYTKHVTKRTHAIETPEYKKQLLRNHLFRWLNVNVFRWWTCPILQYYGSPAASSRQKNRIVYFSLMILYCSRPMKKNLYIGFVGFFSVGYNFLKCVVFHGNSSHHGVFEKQDMLTVFHFFILGEFN